jgi:capsule polysaccharide export protein KpsE/RkpR
VTEVRQNGHQNGHQNGQAAESPILQHLKAAHAYRELERREARLHFAGRVRVVWADRTFLFRISAFGLILGLVIAFLIPARYTSTAQLMAPDNQAGSSLAIAEASLPGRAAGIGQIAGNLLGVRSTSDVFVGILNSRKVQDKIIDQFDLKRVYGTRRMDDTRQALASRASISVDRKNGMIAISVTDRNPQRAAAIANTYVDELNRLVVELSTSSAHRERVFLEGFLVQVKQDLENAERDLSQFSSKNNTIDINEQGKALVGAAATLQGQLMFAQSELQALRQIYTDSNVRVRTAQARIDELQAQLRRLAGKDQASTIGPNTDATELYPSLRKLPLLGATYADLYRRAKVQEAVYEVLTREYDLAKVQEARDIPTVKVLDPANIPDNKSFPPRLLIASSSMLLMFTVGIVLVLGSKSWNDKDPGDLSRAVASEIWIDLKAKRFLNPVNGLSAGPEGDSGSSVRHKGGILSFLGWSAAHLGDGSDSSSECVSETQRPQSKLPKNNPALEN